MKRNICRLLIGGTIVVVLAVLVSYGAFTSLFVCKDCGAKAVKTEWQIPFTSWTVTERTSIQATPLSSMLLRMNRVSVSQPHRWMLVHGSGNGIMCALGRGYDILQAAKSDDVVQLIEVAVAAAQIEFADRLIHCVFDWKTAGGVYALAFEGPLDGLPEAPTFEKWRRDHAESIELSLNAPHSKKN